MKKNLIIFASTLLIMLMLGSAMAMFQGADDATRYRQAVMTLIGHHFGNMASVVKGTSAYTKDAFAKDAQLVETLSTLPWDACLFPGSDTGNTKLKPEALKDPAKFKEAAASLEEQTAKLTSAAASGDIGAIKSQFGEVGKSCKDCHSQFRSQ